MKTRSNISLVHRHPVAAVLTCFRPFGARCPCMDVYRHSLFVLGAVELQDVVQDAVLQVGDELVHAPHKLVPVQSAGEQRRQSSVKRVGIR